jgi:hypothetical protein
MRRAHWREVVLLLKVAGFYFLTSLSALVCYQYIKAPEPAVIEMIFMCPESGDGGPPARLGSGANANG